MSPKALKFWKFAGKAALVSATVAFKVALVVLSVTATLVGLVFKSASQQHNAHRYNY